MPTQPAPARPIRLALFAVGVTIVALPNLLTAQPPPPPPPDVRQSVGTIKETLSKQRLSPADLQALRAAAKNVANNKPATLRVKPQHGAEAYSALDADNLTAPEPELPVSPQVLSVLQHNYEIYAGKVSMLARAKSIDPAALWEANNRLAWFVQGLDRLEKLQAKGPEFRKLLSQLVAAPPQ